MKSYLSALATLEELEIETSRNGKLAILKEESDNEYLTQILNVALDPFKMYGVIKTSYNPQEEKKDVSESLLNEFFELLKKLNARELTGHAAGNAVTELFNRASQGEQKWFDRILKKDLRIGATVSTVNKAIPNLVPVFDCMLAKSWEDVKKKPQSVMVEIKLDGYRALGFVEEDGSVSIRTRNGKLIEGFTAIEKELATLPKGYVYDAEIIGKVEEFGDMQKSVFKKGEEGKIGTLVIFDTLPISEFKEGQSRDGLLARKIVLNELSRTRRDLKEIEFLASTTVFTDDYEDRVQELYDSAVLQGREGIMVKDADSKYVCKRSASWAKWKPFETGDFTVIGVEEGTKRNAGKLGAFIIDYKGHSVNVGSGFSDAEREEYWKNPGQYVGLTIEVQYQDATENKKGGLSLRFPTFKGFREDKD